MEKVMVKYLENRGINILNLIGFFVGVCLLTGVFVSVINAGSGPIDTDFLEAEPGVPRP